MSARLVAISCLVAAVSACGDERANPPTDAATATASASGSGSGSGGGGAGGAAPEGPLGRVFEKTPDDGVQVERPLTRLPDGATTLDGAMFRLRSCTGADCFEDVASLALADDAGNFLYDSIDPPSGQDPAAEVNAYYHLERFAARFEELGFPAIDPDTHVIVGFSYDFDGDGTPDEFFAGATDVLGAPGLVMGIVGSRNMAYDPDVYGHELMHLYQGKNMPALDQFLAPTGLDPVGRALGEGTADYYSCTVMGDPDVGEYGAGAFGGPYLSTLDNSAKCPDDLFGQPHHDGQILSGALWELRTELGADRVDAALRDVLLGLEPIATWPTVAARLREALARRATTDELAAVDAILGERGLPNCSPVVAVTPGAAREMWIGSDDVLVDPDTGDSIVPAAFPSALQLALDVPAGATSVTLAFERDRDAPALEDLEVYVRAASPVGYALVEGDLVVTTDSTIDDASAPIVLQAVAATSLYIGIASRGHGGGFVQVTATID